MSLPVELDTWVAHGSGYRILDSAGSEVGTAAYDPESGASWSARLPSGHWITGFATDLATARVAVKIHRSGTNI